MTLDFKCRCFVIGPFVNIGRVSMIRFGSWTFVRVGTKWRFGKSL